jgi:hypothetical protein
MAHLLALGSVDAFEQRGDETFLDGEFSFKASDFRSEFSDLFFGRFDAVTLSIRRA